MGQSNGEHPNRKKITSPPEEQDVFLSRDAGSRKTDDNPNVCSNSTFSWHIKPTRPDSHLPPWRQSFCQTYSCFSLEFPQLRPGTVTGLSQQHCPLSCGPCAAPVRSQTSDFFSYWKIQFGIRLLGLRPQWPSINPFYIILLLHPHPTHQGQSSRHQLTLQICTVLGCGRKAEELEEAHQSLGECANST